MRTITTKTDRYNENLESETLLIEDARDGTRMSTVHVVPAGREARQVQGGPLVPGPWPYSVLHSAVIDNHGGSAAERDRVPAERRFAIGEPVLVEGLPGVWKFDNRDRRKLEGDGVKLVPAGRPLGA
jgi:hypothetical protein